MSVAYAMADTAPSRDGNVPAGAITLPVDRGGCGQCHEIGLDADGRPCITCETCAPALIGSHYGWAATPHGVPLTCDELASRELAKRDVEASQAILMNAMVSDWMGKLGQPQAPAALPAAPSVADVLAKASPEELLAALPPEMREAMEAAVAAKALEGKEQAKVKPADPRLPRSGKT